MNHHFSTILVISCGLILSGCFPDAAKPLGPDSIETQDAPAIKKIVRSDEEWRSLLTPEQYHILRESGTERPNGETYAEFNRQGAGTYFCGGCDAELFSSKHKFNSHCGWPSFYDPANAKNVVTYEDNTLGVSRVEVRCAVCDGHLGHVFTGEGFDTPTDKRYCINGVALKFVPDE